jgi:hypothetical protein
MGRPPNDPKSIANFRSGSVESEIEKIVEKP